MFDSVALGDTGRKLAGADVRVCSDEELFDAATGLDGLISHAQVAQAHVLAELESRGATEARFGTRTASWVASRSSSARGPIAGRLRVGRALRDHFDRIDEAVGDGTLSFDHAKALCDTSNPRITDTLAAAQDQIVALADGATFDQYKRDVTALAEVADTDGAEPDVEENKLSMPVTIGGNVRLDGMLDAANGLALRTAINHRADELFRRFTRDHAECADIEVPGRSTLRALALVELIRYAIGAEPGTGSAPRAEVTLVLHDHAVTDTEGQPVTQAAADVWGCDPDIWAVIVDRMGIPVDVGHANRLATTAQRHAMAVRDGGCTFPGCDAPIEWCDHHHVVDWHHGGPTDLANLVALCRHHHGITHRTGWAMTLDDHQIPHWTAPSGERFTGQRHRRRHLRRQCFNPDEDPDPPGATSVGDALNEPHGPGGRA